MKTLKRWIKNIKWLLNHPAMLTSDDKEEFTCLFCGSHNSCWKYGSIFTICFSCMAKAYRKVLLPEILLPEAKIKKSKVKK